MPKLESVTITFVHCFLVNKNSQVASNVLFTFASNKKFGQSITIAPHSLAMLNTANTELLSIEVWFNDQNS